MQHLQKLLKSKLSSLLVLFISLAATFPWNQTEDLWGWIFLLALLPSIEATKTPSSRQLYAMLALVLLACSAKLLPSLQIQEGHGLFLKTNVNDPFKQTLPSVVYETLDTEFSLAYPPEQQCPESEIWCWKNRGIPESPFWFSSDSIWQSEVKYSRIVNEISFSSLSDLKTALINDYNTCFYDSQSDIKRDTLPYFVFWEINEKMVGGQFFLKGNAILGNESSGYANITGFNRTITIEASMVGQEFWVYRINPATTLSVEFKPVLASEIARWLKDYLPWVLLAALVCLTLNVHLSVYAYALIISLVSVYIVHWLNSSFLLGHPPLWGGGDGLWFEGFGLMSTQAMAQGDILGFWKGGESAYYLMPFLRYFRSIEDLFFGDTNTLMVLMAIALPLGAWPILSQFYSRRVSFILVVIGSLLPWHLGFLRWAELSTFGLSEPVAFLFLLPAIFQLLRVKPSNRVPILAYLCTAIACGLRPNYLPVGLGLLFYLSVDRFWDSKKQTVLGIVSFLLIMATIPIHNYVFSGRWVWLTTGYAGAKVVSLQDWVLLVPDIITGSFESPHVAAVLKQLNTWLFTTPKIFHKYPFRESIQTMMGLFNLGAFLAAVALLWIRKLDLRLRRLVFVALAAQSTLFLFWANKRYAFLGWDLTYLCLVLAVVDPAVKQIAQNLWGKLRLISIGSIGALIGLIPGYAYFKTPEPPMMELEIGICADHASSAFLFYDMGKGFHETPLRGQFSSNGVETLTYSIPFGAHIIRFDPSDEASGSFEILSARYKGSMTGWIDLDKATITKVQNVVKTTDGARYKITGPDPIMFFKKIPPNPWYNGLLSTKWLQMLLFSWVCGILVTGGYLLLSDRTLRSSNNLRDL